MNKYHVLNERINERKENEDGIGRKEMKRRPNAKRRRREEIKGKEKNGVEETVEGKFLEKIISQNPQSLFKGWSHYKINAKEKSGQKKLSEI